MTQFESRIQLGVIKSPTKCVADVFRGLLWFSGDSPSVLCAYSLKEQAVVAQKSDFSDEIILIKPLRQLIVVITNQGTLYYLSPSLACQECFHLNIPPDLLIQGVDAVWLSQKQLLVSCITSGQKPCLIEDEVPLPASLLSHPTSKVQPFLAVRSLCSQSVSSRPTCVRLGPDYVAFGVTDGTIGIVNGRNSSSGTKQVDYIRVFASPVQQIVTMSHSVAAISGGGVVMPDTPHIRVGDSSMVQGSHIVAVVTISARPSTFAFVFPEPISTLLPVTPRAALDTFTVVLKSGAIYRCSAQRQPTPLLLSRIQLKPEFLLNSPQANAAQSLSLQLRARLAAFPCANPEELTNILRHQNSGTVFFTGAEGMALCLLDQNGQLTLISTSENIKQIDAVFASEASAEPSVDLSLGPAASYLPATWRSAPQAVCAAVLASVAVTNRAAPCYYREIPRIHSGFDVNQEAMIRFLSQDPCALAVNRATQTSSLTPRLMSSTPFTPSNSRPVSRSPSSRLRPSVAFTPQGSPVLGTSPDYVVAQPAPSRPFRGFQPTEITAQPFVGKVPLLRSGVQQNDDSNNLVLDDRVLPPMISIAPGTRESLVQPPQPQSQSNGRADQPSLLRNNVCVTNGMAVGSTQLDKIKSLQHLSQHALWCSRLGITHFTGHEIPPAIPGTPRVITASWKGSVLGPVVQFCASIPTIRAAILQHNPIQCTDDPCLRCELSLAVSDAIRCSQCSLLPAPSLTMLARAFVHFTRSNDCAAAPLSVFLQATENNDHAIRSAGIAGLITWIMRFILCDATLLVKHTVPTADIDRTLVSKLTLPPKLTAARFQLVHFTGRPDSGAQLPLYVLYGSVAVLQQLAIEHSLPPPTTRAGMASLAWPKATLPPRDDRIRCFVLCATIIGFPCGDSEEIGVCVPIHTEQWKHWYLLHGLMALPATFNDVSRFSQDKSPIVALYQDSFFTHPLDSPCATAESLPPVDPSIWLSSQPAYEGKHLAHDAERVFMPSNAINIADSAKLFWNDIDKPTCLPGYNPADSWPRWADSGCALDAEFVHVDMDVMPFALARDSQGELNTLIQLSEDSSLCVGWSVLLSPVRGQKQPMNIFADTVHCTAHCCVHCSIIDQHENILCDDYSKPHLPVVDYVSRYSGIHPADLQPETCDRPLRSLKTITLRIRALAEAGVIFIGHGIRSDFSVLGVSVSPAQIADTAELCYNNGGQLISLQSLSSTVLNEPIQVGEHNSLEDARASWRVWAKFLEKA